MTSDSPPPSPVPAAPRGARLAAVIATWFGAGLLPKAPGTWGTLAAVPLAWALAHLGQLAFLVAIALVSAIGSWAAEVYCRLTQRHDNQRIVVDEVAGYLLTLVAVPRTPANLALAFVLFRLFDITKPPPVRWIDRNVKGGFGVVADDLGAGVYGALALWLLGALGLTAWLDRMVFGIVP